MQFNQVQLRAVAFVLAEAIFGKARAEVAHNRVARDLRDHARRGNAEAVAIAIDNRRLWERKRKNREAIDQHVIGTRSQRFNGGAHCLVSGAEDVDRINLDRIDDSDRPRDQFVRNQFLVNFFATFRQQLLGIVQPPVLEFFRQDYSRRDDRSGQRAAPRFINAGDRGDTESA